MSDFGFSKILSNDFAKKYLADLALSEDVPQSIIITGEEGIGKLIMAEEFALSLLCANPTEKGACGECNSCKTYKAKQNPNIAYWYPKGQNTTIDQMRTLKEMSAYSPLNNKYKINIIQKGDTLNEEASNSILKIIEEPPSYLINILIYNNPHNILQTIRSRSIVVNMNPAPKNVIKEKLIIEYGLENSYAEFVSAYSMGSYGKALYFANNEKRDEIRNIVFNCIHSIISRPMELLYLADMLSDKKNYFSESGKSTQEEIKSDTKNFYPYPIECEITNQNAVLFIIDLLALSFRDMLAIKGNAAEELINIDKKEEIASLAGKITEENIIKAIHILWETKDKLRANINTTIALQSMLCKMLITLKSKE